MEELRRQILEYITNGLSENHIDEADTIAADIEGHADAMAAIETLADALQSMGY